MFRSGFHARRAPFLATLGFACLQALLLVMGGALPATGQTAVATAEPAQRYLVVYRNHQVPAEVESRMATAGARVQERHELLGVAVIEAKPATARALTTSDPNVEYVVPDVLLYAHSLTVVQTQAAQPSAAIASPDALYHSP
jgi:hypothetical protein